MNYQQKDLVRIAKRENNTKRNYLVVDPLQGKHVPVQPSNALLPIMVTLLGIVILVRLVQPCTKSLVVNPQIITTI